jgi:hypothetical protein
MQEWSESYTNEKFYNSGGVKVPIACGGKCVTNFFL